LDGEIAAPDAQGAAKDCEPHGLLHLDGSVSVELAKDYLGPAKFETRFDRGLYESGVATGLAWTPERRLLFY